MSTHDLGKWEARHLAQRKNGEDAAIDVLGKAVELIDAVREYPQPNYRALPDEQLLADHIAELLQEVVNLMSVCDVDDQQLRDAKTELGIENGDRFEPDGSEVGKQPPEALMQSDVSDDSDSTGKRQEDGKESLIQHEERV